MTLIFYYSSNVIRPIVPFSLIHFFKLNIKCVDISKQEDNFSSLFPLKLTPALFDDSNGWKLTEAIAINNYLIKIGCKQNDPSFKKETLLGWCIKSESEILRWESMAVSDFLNGEVDVIGPNIGLRPYNKEKQGIATEKLNIMLDIYETQLHINKGFLVGDHITLADLVTASCFYFGFRFYYDSEWRKNYPNIVTWYQNVTKSSYFNDFFKDKELIEKRVIKTQ